MLIFSPTARQLIDNAVLSLHPADRQIWVVWSAEHPHGRGPGEPADDERGPLPAELVDVLLAALEAKRSHMAGLFDKRTLSEDEISDLDNDLSHLRAVEQAIRDNVALHRAVVSA
jgi:hypothetical protein